MAVNGVARRFVNELTSIDEFGLAMYESHKSVPTIPAFLICDSAFLQKWGLGLALPGGRPFRRLVKAGYLVQGATIDDLARQLSLDPAALASTLARFNALAEKGEDTDFGKGGNSYNRYLGDPAITEGNPCLGPITKGPFYAVRVYPGDIGTAGGMIADRYARALDARGQPYSRALCLWQRYEFGHGRNHIPGRGSRSDRR